MRQAIPVIAALALVACGPKNSDAPAENATAAATPAETGPTQEEIEAVLADSAAGWNTGDMDRFLAVYSTDPATSFVNAEGIARGRSQMEATYRDAYDWSKKEPDERGILSLEGQDFRPLGPDHALYIARYVLSYSDGSEPVTGLTSLVFAREADGWRIIADHSS